MVRISWRLDSANGILLAYYLTYTRVDDTKDSKTIKTTKSEVILTGLKLGKTYSFVVRNQFVYLRMKVAKTLSFETIYFFTKDSVYDASYSPLLYSKVTFKITVMWKVLIWLFKQKTAFSLCCCCVMNHKNV